MGPHPAVAATRTAVSSVLTSRVLVACSGGADSLALAAATAFVAPRMGVPAGLVTVDHGLQPGSAEQAAWVAEIGRDLGLEPVLTLRVEVGRRGGPEAAARTARYEALTEAARAEGASIALGHTMDDQAETVLLGLGRGSGPRSICGMRRNDGAYLRPFLGLRRSTTRAACAALGLHAWDDPHNVDARFQRVRIRTEVLPLLEDVLQSGVVEALARTADLLQADLDVVESCAATVLDQLDTAGNTLQVAALEPLPTAIRTRVLRRWLGRAVAEPLSAERTDAVDALVTAWRGQGPIDLPGGACVQRVSGTLVLAVRSAPRPPAQQE